MIFCHLIFFQKSSTAPLYVRLPNESDGMANSVNPDQTTQSNQGLHCLLDPSV